MSENVLTSNQRRAIIALLANTSIRAAAAACGLCEKTVSRYLADDDFRAELRARQDEAAAAMAAGLAGLAGKALSVLDGVMDDDEAGDSVKVRAALGVVSERRKAQELDVLSGRVADLERRLKGDGKPNTTD